MSISAMKQAVEAWESAELNEVSKAMVALCQAIAEAEDAVAAEREACAKVCEERERANLYGVKECAAAIRARGEK